MYCAVSTKSLYMINCVRTLKGSCDDLPSQPLAENILYEPQYKARFCFQRGKQKSRSCLTSKALMALPNNTIRMYYFPVGSD